MSKTSARKISRRVIQLRVPGKARISSPVGEKAGSGYLSTESGKHVLNRDPGVAMSVSQYHLPPGPSNSHR
jgi:hypothetical protein